jgi:hypothetical protein
MPVICVRLSINLTVFTNRGTTSFKYIDHIFTNAAELCSEAVSTPIGYSDHNIVAIFIKAKVPRAGPKIVYKRSYRRFSSDTYVEDLKKYMALHCIYENCSSSYQ